MFSQDVVPEGKVEYICSKIPTEIGKLWFRGAYTQYMLRKMMIAETQYQKNCLQMSSCRWAHKQSLYVNEAARRSLVSNTTMSSFHFGTTT